MKAGEERTYLLFYPAQPPIPTTCARRMGRTSPHAFLTGPLLTGALRCGMHDLCVPFASSPGSTGSKRVASPLVERLACTALWKDYTVRSEALQLMHRFQKQIRSYDVHKQEYRLLRPQMPSKTYGRIFMVGSIESCHTSISYGTMHSILFVWKSGLELTPVGIQV